MVSNTSDDLPEPETPVTTVRVLCGISKSMFLRLWTRAPRTMMLSFDIGRTVLDPAALRHCGLPTTGFGSTAESFDYKWSNKAGSIALSRSAPPWATGRNYVAGEGARATNCVQGGQSPAYTIRAKTHSAGLDSLSFFFFHSLIVLARIDKPGADQDGHHAHGGDQEHDHGTAERLLALGVGAQGGGVAHGAALSEGGRAPQQESESENGQAQLHFTPRLKMRKASAKNTNISVRQTTRATISTHFMRAISNFRCMK